MRQADANIERGEELTNGGTYLHTAITSGLNDRKGLAQWVPYPLL